MDLKADRATGALNVCGAFIEPDRDPVRTVNALVTQLHAMAGWLGLRSVTVGDRGDLCRALARAL